MIESYMEKNIENCESSTKLTLFNFLKASILGLYSFCCEGARNFPREIHFRTHYMHSLQIIQLFIRNCSFRSTIIKITTVILFKELHFHAQ